MISLVLIVYDLTNVVNIIYNSNIRHIFSNASRCSNIAEFTAYYRLDTINIEYWKIFKSILAIEKNTIYIGVALRIYRSFLL